MIPLEIITLLGSTVLSWATKWMSARSEAKQHRELAMIQAMSKEADIVKDAREVADEGFKWTRRTIALLSVLSVIVLPKIAALVWPEIQITVGYTEFHPGFFFQEGKEILEWKEVRGLTLTPLDTHLVMAVVGMYFGRLK